MGACPALLVLLCVTLTSAWRSIQEPPLTCPRQDVYCKVSITNCLDRGWLKSHEYTPSGPVKELLQVSWDIRNDEAGHPTTVLVTNWTLQDDGSIHFLKATELHVLMISTNQNMCVRYSFNGSLQARSPSGDKWSFSADMVVLDPGQKYRVSVFNIPKPEEGNSNYDISKDVEVPDCDDPKVKMTQFCIERGSLWQPNISVTPITAGKRISALVVSFSPDSLGEEYIVTLSCLDSSYAERVYKGNRTTFNATFSLDKWPRSCCEFEAQIKPLFQQCGQDCTRRKTSYTTCVVPPSAKPPEHIYTYTFVACGVILVCVVTAIVLCVIYRKPGKFAVAEELGVRNPPPRQPDQRPTVLVIYSQDHRLYRDIVLKLCAFLRAKCGTNVLVDLLDTTSVGMVGRVRWLEWQRQQLKNPSDKILVLCSRGVQAKWRAMCGQERVTLKEDLLSPTDDMLTPFLNLFLPDMHQAGMLGKYVVAYFDDISSDEDVPSVFDIAVKYKLMKHFEELFFRIADIEKYQPGQVNHIEGIGGQEYFTCPSGRELKNAIEAFQAYQLENPDWFEKECVSNEEELMNENNLLIDQLQIPPVLECVPLINDGRPIYIHEVEIAENTSSVHVVTPEVNLESHLSSVVEVTPAQPRGINLQQVLTDHLFPQSHTQEPVYVVEPVLNRPPTLGQNWLSLEKEPLARVPTEDDEEDSLLPMSQVSPQSDLRSSALENTQISCPVESSCSNVDSDYFPPSTVNQFQPVEMDEDEVLEPSGKGPSSGSDQGYISKTSSLHESQFKEDPLVALARLQEELFQQNL